eukprot:CAMPEP_0114259434 /NCGR_PEP_ID=MMETSP0058-20121206/19892_1 /TAXON_ID=36894 /ORGANISM="Pyramimonas parkeae, CCMP726" /LENGTH=394 /DNA_ID=CAMNT_0001374483 /DNA_START=1251 /DNA_END=2435 /DNA_ORIENTATION=-
MACLTCREWVQGLSTSAHLQDVAIIAGDITDKLEILEETMQLLVDRFAHVFFTPGNHDLWCRGTARSASENSLGKLAQILSMCARLGVHTGPYRIPASGSQRACWIVPMLSWYHASFDDEPDIEYLQLPPVEHVVRDFSSCTWPEHLKLHDDGVAQHLDLMNEHMDAMTSEGLMSGDELYEFIQNSGEAVVSFSHFLPRVELLPEKRYLFFPNLAKVVGSNMLRSRVERLKPDVHLFGHTHFGWDQTLDGIRYIQAALAYPRERKARKLSLTIGTAPEELQCIYNSSDGGHFADQLSAQWSDFYQTNKRDPLNMELASWVRPQYQAQVEKWEQSRASRQAWSRSSSEEHSLHVLGIGGSDSRSSGSGDALLSKTRAHQLNVRAQLASTSSLVAR